MSYVTDPRAAGQTQGWNQAWAKDGHLHVHFYPRSVLDERATHGYEEERQVQNDDGSLRVERKRFPGAGRPIFKEVVYIKIFTPGDPTNIVDREKWPHDEEEYSQQWQRFLEHGEKGQISGTPLEMLPGLPAPRIEELKALPGAPVRTVEELANMSDATLQRFVGLHGDRQRARDWLAAMEKAAPLNEARAEIAKRDQRIEEQGDQLKALQDQLSEMRGMLEQATRPTAPAEEPDENVAPRAPTVRRAAR